jgi:hypothetical protein
LWTATGLLIVGALATALGTQRLGFGEHGGLVNPFAVSGTPGAGLRVVSTIVQSALFLTMVVALASVVARLRRSSGVERQQLKWIALAFAVLLGGLFAAALGEASGWEALGNVGWTVFLVGLLLGMPLAIATAILRHHLYDIDVVIRRTLVYGALTATLAGTYGGLVLLIGLAVGRTGFATAVSTLAVAALFQPARARIQAAVDRHFYRRRYDAARTLEAFGAQLREELDLDALAADLRRVVRETLQPAHVSLWLRSRR